MSVAFGGPAEAGFWIVLPFLETQAACCELATRLHESLRADRVVVVLLDPNGALGVGGCEGIQIDSLDHAPLSLSVLNDAAADGKTILSGDARWDHETRLNLTLQLSQAVSLLCVPFFDSTGRPAGAIYIDTISREGAFRHNELRHARHCALWLGHRLAGEKEAPFPKFVKRHRPGPDPRQAPLAQPSVPAVERPEERQAVPGHGPARHRVRPQAVALFYRQLAVMLGAGVPLANCLEFLLHSEVDSGMRSALERLSDGVLTGSSLSAAMSKPGMGQAFDPVSVAMIQVGEGTGQLQRIAQKLADSKERSLALTRSLISALTYPTVLLLTLLLMAALFTYMLGPGKNGLFSAFGNDLPWPTRVVRWAGSWGSNPLAWAAALFGLLGVAALGRHLIATRPKLRLKFHAVLLTLPGLGPLLRKLECARVLFVLADGLEVGLPANRVLAMAAQVCSNDSMRQRLEAAYESFVETGELGLALDRQQLFPPLVLSMIEVGVESGTLDVVLRQASHAYEDDVRMALEAFTRLVEPVLLLFAGALAAFLALATLLPIIGMVSSLGS